MNNYSGDRPAAGRSSASGTAVAMVAGCDLALMESIQIKVTDMSGRTMAHRQIEHLVEVAVVERAVPTYRDCISAHDAGRGSGIEGVGQSLHILLIVAALQEKLKKPTDRHVGDRIEVIELDAMASAEFFAKLRFDGFLLGGEKGSDWIADQVQDEAAIGTAIPESIQALQGLDGFFKDAFTPLRIGLADAVIGQRCDDLHTMLGEKLCQVCLGRKEQHRQVTAIHHMAIQCPALFDQPTKIGVEFWRSTRDIDRRNIGLSERAGAVLSCFAGHALGAIRPRIDMTMSAYLIAELANIDLKDGNPGGAKREQPNAIELCLERRVARCPPEYLQLLRWGGEGILLSQQGQGHRIMLLEW